MSVEKTGLEEVTTLKIRVKFNLPPNFESKGSIEEGKEISKRYKEAKSPVLLQSRFDIKWLREKCDTQNAERSYTKYSNLSVNNQLTELEEYEKVTEKSYPSDFDFMWTSLENNCRIGLSDWLGINDVINKIIDGRWLNNRNDMMVEISAYPYRDQVIFIPVIREIDERIKINFKEYFSEWNKYIDIDGSHLNISIDDDKNIEINFWKEDETGSTLMVNKATGSIINGRYNIYNDIDIYRGDFNVLSGKFPEQVNSKQIPEKNIIADEMGHAFFDIILWFDVREYREFYNDSKITFEYDWKEVTIFELGELCSMISQLRFGENFSKSAQWIYGWPDISQYNFWKEIIKKAFSQRLDERDTFLIQNYLEYLDSLDTGGRYEDQEKYEKEKDIIVSMIEEEFFKKNTSYSTKSKR